MISNKIKEFREQQSLTQEELGQAVGVSRQTIIAIEKGNYEPSLGLALKLSKFFSAKSTKLKVEDIFVLK